MEWEFTPEDVVKARVDYGLKHFRCDLSEEVRNNTGHADEAQHLRTFNLIYDMCYALATARDMDEFLAPYAYDPPTCEFLREIAPMMSSNVEMLGAILQRMIIDAVESGLPLERALDDAAERHSSMVARSN